MYAYYHERYGLWPFPWVTKIDPSETRDIELRLTAEQPPGSSEAWYSGDGVELVKSVTLHFVIKAANEKQAWARYQQIYRRGRIAIYLVEMDETIPMRWRALAGNGKSIRQITTTPFQIGLAGPWRFSVTYNPKFALWTPGRAYSQFEYDDALSNNWRLT